MDVKDIKDAHVTHAGLLQHNADGTTELQKITHAGLIARSPEGTAAKGMNIRGNEDLWVEIQANTFRNWVNEHLKDANMQVSDLTTDLCDGTHLCALVENLQKRPLRPAWNRRPGNQHHFLENATVALNAIEQDGIKLVNIGNVDIVNGNVKLILGLIWSLIVRYQIGRSKFPPRKLMLAWLQAVLPDCRINNLTTDWNSGVNLSALLEYCEPGLFPHWRTVDPAQSVRNCETAMNVALREFGVPKVLEPEYLASPWLDELSGMTYLSYFMKVGGPGYKATMRWVNGQTRRPVTNFTSDWNDGRVFCEIVKQLGGAAPDPEKLSVQQHNWESNITKAVNAGKQLGVTPILAPKDMANPDVEHLGIMSYAANLQWVTPRPPLSNLLAVHLDSSSGRVGEPTYFTVELLSRELSLSDVRVTVLSPSGHAHPVKIGDHGRCSFVPDKYGMHEIQLEVDDQRLGGHFFRVLPRHVHVAPPGMAPCALGSLVEVLVNATGAPKTEDILVTAFSPTGRSLPCPLKNVGHEGHSAIFKPDEAGVWQIAITYQGRHIQGGPFTCAVFDPNGVSVHGLDGAMPLRAHSFEVDARGVGVPAELHVDLVHEKRSLVCSVEKLTENKYRVTFMPRTNGKYRVYVYCNGYDVKGSPYIMRVGTKGRSGKTRSSSREPAAASSREASPATGKGAVHLNDFRTVKKELYAHEDSARTSGGQRARASPIQEEATSMYKKKEYYSNKRQDTQLRSSPMPELHSSTANLNATTAQLRNRETSYSPLPHDNGGGGGAEPLYTTSLKSPLAKTPSYNDPYSYGHPNSGSDDVVDHHHDSTTTMNKSSTSTSTTKNYTSEKYVSSSTSSMLHEPTVQRIASPLGHMRNSPVANASATRYETTVHNVRSSTPTASNGVSRRDSSSPNNGASYYISQSAHRVASPQNSAPYGRVRSPSPIRLQQLRVSSSPVPVQSTAAPTRSNGATSYKVTEETSTYKRTNNIARTSDVADGTRSPSYFGVKPSTPIGGGFDTIDHSPNIRVSKANAGRRDSWDVINKTKHLLSHNSLESLANMPESQLNTDLSYSRPSVERDLETERNTRYNKYALSATGDKMGLDARRVTHSPTPVRIASTAIGSSHRDTSTSRNHSTTHHHQIVAEDSSHQRQHYVTASSDDDYGYVGRFRPIADDAIGAGAIRVQNIPDGVLGRPVSFEIDGSRAGSGNLEILVNGGRVTSSVRALGTQRFVASFTPHEIGRHTVQITFNDETVPGSPWLVDIMSSPGLTPLGESTRLVPAHSPAVFEILPPPGMSLPKATAACVATVQTPSKATLAARVTHEPNAASGGALRIEFVPNEVGTHIVDAQLDGVKLVGGPLVAKVYDTGLIQVTEVNGGVVAQPCQFRVDASAAGEGQLEISINEGEVPNHVQVVGGGRCLVSFTPEQAKAHYIDIKFNGETVRGCPFVCAVADTSRVMLNLSNLELIPVNAPATFHIAVSGGGPAELAVSVRGPHGELPVRVTGDVHAGFTSEFTPAEVGTHAVSVEYNGYPVQGTPFQAKSYDASRVSVGSVTQGTVGRPVQFTVDAGDAGEGNLEITISAKGHNIPTQVHPQGNAKFAVSFVPAEPCEHVISVSFNKAPVPGCPIAVAISGGVSGPQVSLGGPGPVHAPNSLVITHAGGRLEDVEVNVEGPSGQSVPAQVSQTAEGLFKADFVPRLVGEHRVSVTVQGQPTAGSPYAAKVYDVTAIKVKNVSQGTVGKSVTFLVETSQAGPGNLEVTVNGGRVPTSAQAQGQHTYAISFTPRDAQHHTVELRFNGQDVPGSPFTCAVCAAARILAADTLDKICVGRPFEFAVESDVLPVVQVLGPARANVPVRIEPAADTGYRIQFEPRDVGDHSVEVRLPQSDHHVEGSPFLLKAYSAEKVIVTDIRPGLIGKSVSFGINASQAGAGNLEIIVAVAGKNVPNFVQSEGNARFKVNFKPTEAAAHSLSVRFNGHAVPGSPFTCHIAAAAVAAVPAALAVPLTATASGEALKQAAIAVDNTIELAGFEAIEPQVFVTDPSGAALPCRLQLQRGGGGGDDSGRVYVCTFRPATVGRHLIGVTAGERQQHIDGSPFSCNAFDVARVSISGLEPDSGRARLAAPVTFSVDAAGAGEGTLELVVSTATSTVKAEVVACARGLYDVTFVPLVCRPHFVHITFNDVPVAGNPFQIDVEQTAELLQLGAVARVELLLAADEHRVQVVGPDGEPMATTTTAMDEGYVEFGPVEAVGAYQVRMLDVDTGKLVGARTVNVFDAAQVRVVEVGEAFCGRAAAVALAVPAAAAGAGRLTALVRCGRQEVAHTVRGPSKGGVWEVLYHPQRVAPHRIAVWFNGVPVLSQPIEINVLPLPAAGGAGGDAISVSGLGVLQSRVGRTTSFAIDTAGRAAREFDVVVSGPGGEALPVRCYQTKGGQLQAEYTINKIGQCLIEVLHQSKQVPGSPFTCESFDPTRIVTHSNHRGQLHVVHRSISFVMSTIDAGHAEIEATCTTATGHMLPVRIGSAADDGDDEANGDNDATDAGHTVVEFTPHSCEPHRLTVTYGGEPVPGTPITFDVCSAADAAAAVATPYANQSHINNHNNQNNNNNNGHSIGNLNNGQHHSNGNGRNGSGDSATIRASGTGLEVAHRAKEAAFTVFCPGTPNVQIERVDEAGDRVEPRVKLVAAAGAGSGNKGGASEWRVAYTLLSVGMYEIRVSCPARGALPGSPWRVNAVDTNKVMPVGGWGGHLDGDGRLVLPARFVFDISAQAGPGELVCTVDGRELAVTKQSDGKSSIFIPVDGLAAGEYNFDLTFSGVPVSASPRSAYVSQQQHTAHEMVHLTGRGLAAAQSGEPAHFTIDATAAPAGRPEVLLTYQSDNAVLAVSLTQPHAAEAVWLASYTPVRTGGGGLQLTVKWNGRVVKGCPLTVAVGSAIDATKVLCSGEGLRNGVVGREIRSWIDTRRAGPGELSAHCAGPRKVAYCELYDHGDATFTLNVKPQEAGRHALTIKYGGQHVGGSPFALKVAGAPDASKVRVYGPGIEHGVLATFQSRFICDTRGAGAGQLTVRVRGPKGAFRVEMQRESQKDRTILCKYDPTEPGDYRVEVKWAGELVPGSPFPVMIFDTEEELRRFMQGAA